MVKKSSLQNTRPIECFDFENFESEIANDGIFCNVIREFGSCAQEFESRTYKFKFSAERRVYLLEDFGHRDVELEVYAFPSDQTLGGGVVFSKQGLYLGCLGFSADHTHIVPSFIPDAYLQQQVMIIDYDVDEVETVEEKPEREESEAEANNPDTDNINILLPTDENENRDLVEKALEAADVDMEDQASSSKAISSEQDETTISKDHVSDAHETTQSFEKGEDTRENEELENEELENEKLENEKLENEKLENEKLENEKLENEDLGESCQISEDNTLENVDETELSKIEVDYTKRKSTDLEFVISVDHSETNESEKDNDLEETTPTSIQTEDNTVNNHESETEGQTDRHEEITSETNTKDIEHEKMHIPNDENEEQETTVATDITKEDTSEVHNESATSNTDLIGEQIVDQTVIVAMDTEVETDSRETGDEENVQGEQSPSSSVDGPAVGQILEMDVLVQSEPKGMEAVESENTLEGGVELSGVEITSDIDQDINITRTDEKNTDLDNASVQEREPIKDDAGRGLISPVEDEVVKNVGPEVEDTDHGNASVQESEPIEDNPGEGLIHVSPVEDEVVKNAGSEDEDTDLDNASVQECVPIEDNPGLISPVDQDEVVRNAGPEDEIQCEISEPQQDICTDETHEQAIEESHEEGKKVSSEEILNEETSEQASKIETLELSVPEKTESDTLNDDIVVKHEEAVNDDMSVKPDIPDGLQTDAEKDVIELSKPVLSDLEAGDPLEPDDLLSTKITNNPKALDDLSVLLDTEYQHGGVSSWHDLAELLAIPKEAYDHCLSFSKPSPTEDLMVFLSNTKPQLTISDLKDSLRSISRPDVVHILDRYIAMVVLEVMMMMLVLMMLLVDDDDNGVISGGDGSYDDDAGIDDDDGVDDDGVDDDGVDDDGVDDDDNGSIISDETVIQGVIEIDDIDLLGQLALKLDRGHNQNWKLLARQLEVPGRIFRNFGSHQRQNSALLMLKYLPIFDPDLIVDSLKDTCQAIGLLEVVKFLDASGVPGEDAIMDILDDTDVIDELTDLLNEEDEEGPNWKKLGRKLNIPERKFSIFEPSTQNSPTKMLLQSIAQCEPDITVDELILALVAMKRHDVIEMLGKHFRSTQYWNDRPNDRLTDRPTDRLTDRPTD
ncbi:hypothetical protein QZH41_005156 [Actinostola sp. cb2023]|nr:hypothetical protein QZH41_005156 [Actinostola sp. cb2023]